MLPKMLRQQPEDTGAKGQELFRTGFGKYDFLTSFLFSPSDPILTVESDAYKK